MIRKLSPLLFLFVSLISFAKEYTFSPGDILAMKQLVGSGKLQFGDVVVFAFGLLVRVGVYERPTPETDVKKEPLISYHRVENVDMAYNTF